MPFVLACFKNILYLEKYKEMKYYISMDEIKALIKWILSHFKRNWSFEDYPTKTWKNKNAIEKKDSFGACIVNWALMVEHGETPEKALLALKNNFKLKKDNNVIFPRPGTKVPIKYASTEKIELYEKTAYDFFKNILDMNFYNGFYSDQSYLYYFELSEDEELVSKFRENIIKKTLLFYNIDITNIYYEPLWKILEHIEINKT
jgi:hypothetical protein